MINIAFCFIVKDGEKYLDKNLQNIINLAILICDKYKIFYVENDSIDNTKEILKKFKSENNNILGKHITLDKKHSIELCSNIFDVNCLKRVRRLAYLRNIALEKAKEWSKCNYMIMLDLDFIDFDKKEFINMFDIINKNNNIDGIFGISITPIGTLYDLGAVKPKKKILPIILEQKLIKVNSAFSGFGIYRMKPIMDKNLNYNINCNNNEHINFNENFNNLFVYTPFRPIYEARLYILCLGIYFISNYINFLLILLIFYLIYKLFIK